MSSSLEWEPTTKHGKSLEADKFALRDVYGDPVNIVLNEENLKELRVMQALGKDVKELIELIEKHGSVRVKEVW